MNHTVSLTPEERRYIESQGDPGTDYYWWAIEQVMTDRINKALESASES